MTRLRRQRFLPRGLSRLAAGSLMLVAALWQAGSGMAATTEQIVIDRNTGVAIYGFDPVAYFTDRTAKLGRDELEARHAGVAWHFANEGNQAAFADHPDVYMPRYGGHDPVALAEGIGRPGHPEFFVIHEDRLYLFYDAQARQKFSADPGGMLLHAEANWPHVSQTLTP